MVASELRIGNWVLSLGKDGVWYNSRVSKLTQEEIIVGVGFKRELKPILLSEYILLKSGFSNADKNSETWQWNRYWIGDFEISDQGDYFEHILGEVIIKYLHQLQNLYFALTGKELEIEL